MNTKRLVTVLLVISAVLLVVLPAAAQDTSTPVAPTTPEASAATTTTQSTTMVASTDLFATTSSRLNVRSGPGTQYTILGQLRGGDALDITGINAAEPTWLRVNFNGQEGWISANFVEITGTIANSPVIDPTTIVGTLRNTNAQTNLNLLRDVVVVTRFNTNLRDTFNTNSNVLTIIPHSTELQLLGRTANNNWVQVNFGDQIGWVSSGLLFFQQGNINNLPVLNIDGSIGTTGSTDSSSSTTPSTGSGN